jgi:mannose-6-phosphate isomerase-like protein (cupin superfamily)
MDRNHTQVVALLWKNYCKLSPFSKNSICVSTMRTDYLYSIFYHKDFYIILKGRDQVTSINRFERLNSSLF